MDWESYKNKSSNQPPSKAIEDFLNDFFNKPGTLFKIIVVAAIVGAGLSSFYTVKVEEKAVVTRFGEYLSTSDAGLHFKLPFGIDTVVKVPTRVREETFGFTSQGRGRSFGLQRVGFQQRGRISDPNRSTRVQNESLMLTGDLNVADVQWVVQYIVVSPRDYLFNVANPVKNIRDLAQTVMRQVVGDVSINNVLTIGKARVESDVKVLMQKVADEYGMGVNIEQVNLQDVNPPDPVQDSFNEVNSALQEQKQAINRAEADYNKVIPEARGRAEEQVSIARGYAKAAINRSQGDAEKFTKILKEFRKAPEITRTRLYLDVVQEVMERVGSFTVVDPQIKGLLPIFGQSDSTPFKKGAKAQLKPSKARGAE